MHKLEKKIVVLLNRNRSKSLDVLSGFISSVPLLVALWFAVAGYVMLRDLLVGVFVLLGLIVVFLLHFLIGEGIIKWGGKMLSLERERPYRAYPEEIKPVGKKFLDSSFPSSHMASMAGGLTVLVYFYGFIWPLAVVSLILMGWSRLRNGMHYPTDILAGLILGIIYGNLALVFLRIIF